MLIEAPVDPTAGIKAPVARAVEPATASNGPKDDLHNRHPPQDNILVNSPSDVSPSAAIEETCSKNIEDTQAGSREATSLSAFEALMNPQSIPTSEGRSTVVGGSFDFSDSTVNCVSSNPDLLKKI